MTFVPVQRLAPVTLLVLLLGGSADARPKYLSRARVTEDTPVMQAALDGDVARMKDLLDHKSAVNITGDSLNGYSSMTPLMVSGEKDDVTVLRMLLKAGADPRLRVPRHNNSAWPPFGWSARCFARSTGAARAEKLLVKAGSPGDEACLLEADFLAAVSKKKVQKAQQLGQRAKGRIQQRVLADALDLAAEQKNVPMVRAVEAAGLSPRGGIHLNMAVPAGTDVSMRPGSRITISPLPAVEVAFREDNEKALLALVKKGAEPPPLSQLVEKRMRLVVKHLLKKGANPNEKQPLGDTALVKAVQARDWDLTEALLAAGADVNLTGASSSTPLLTSMQGTEPVDTALVRRLVEAGADIDKSDSTRTPLKHAAGVCLPDIVSLLLQRGARWSLPPSGGTGLYEEALRPRAPCTEEDTLRVVQALRAGGVLIHAQELMDPGHFHERARQSSSLGAELFAAGLVPERKRPKSRYPEGSPLREMENLGRAVRTTTPLIEWELYNPWLWGT
ncbi:ankyrin repeat domain-containing protein [Myxococcus sp. K38C18041901]|uniref:ankyrin repeat domain-containing protein n=1 Tax=Myxococcus guangdongensis TaxID=2906760 RepID=UPI0020A70AC5|nr:ankyrin repeat domain-containing protein [Myxococcus guangdongensis]MCP3057708.1 ankyrin repeat domain-containing protein [Myxococcus guangdongensis]